MKSRSAVSEKIEIEENEGINYLKFAHLEKSGSLKAGLILGHKDGTRLDPSDIPGLISKVSDISEEKFNVVIPRQVHQTQIQIFKEKVNPIFDQSTTEHSLTDLFKKAEETISSMKE